jgi:Family of unknown function (DUF6262)
MTTTERSAPMLRARRVDSEHKRALVLAAADAQLEAGRHPSIASIARHAGVGRKFIYDHPDLRAAIELKLARAATCAATDMTSGARVTSASLRAELENARAQASRLAKQVRALEARLSKAEGARLVAEELLPDHALAELADQQLAKRAAELDQELFEAKEQLRHMAEELEAARAINRELMQQANRPCQVPGTGAPRRARGPSGPATDKEDSP